MTNLHQGVDAVPVYFLCYARIDSPLADRIEAKLANRRRRGQLAVWRDLRNLEAGAHYTPEIEAVLQTVVGAIVLVSDEWYASEYVQVYEWPLIARRNEREDLFRVFILATTLLDDDDELRSTYNFINDNYWQLRYAPDELRDQILTRLSDQLAKHASSVGLAPALDHTVRAKDDRESFALASHAIATNEQIGPARSSINGSTVKLSGVPPLPRNFVEPPEMQVIIDRIRSPSASRIVGLCGEGGTGKTILAACAAQRLVYDFRDGVYWVTVGERATSADVIRLHAELLARLDATPDRAIRDLNEGKILLEAALAQMHILLIVDDVWHPWHARAFDVMTSSRASRILITSRSFQTIPANSTAIDVDRLSDSEAKEFLATTAGVPPNRADLACVLDVAGGLRLALAVLAATVRADGWTVVVDRLDGLHNRFGRGDEASSAHKALHVGIASLDDSERNCLWTLAAFPSDTSVPLSVLTKLWNAAPVTANIASRLEERELVTVSRDTSGRVALLPHDHVHDFLMLECPQPVADTHLRIWELANTLSPTPAELIDVEPYVWDRFVWHAVRADLNSASLLAIASDPHWLTSRIHLAGVQAAEQDLTAIAERTGLAGDAPLSRLCRVLRHGGLFEDLGAADLAESLGCWADAVGLVFGPGDRRARLVFGGLPIPSESMIRTIRGHASAVWGVAYSPNGMRIATASLDGTARIWSPETGEQFATLGGHTGEVWSLAYSPDGARIATASRDGTARIWNSDTGELLIILKGHTDEVRDVAFSPDGARIATASRDGTARIWNPTTGESLRTLEGHTGEVWGLAYAPDGKRVATASFDKTARFWNPQTGEMLATVEGQPDVARSVRSRRRSLRHRVRRQERGRLEHRDVFTSIRACRPY